MQYSSIILAALAASNTLAAPWKYQSADNSIRVTLSDLGETGTQNEFPEGVRATQSPATSGPFKTVELTLGPDVKNQDYRCQILDHAKAPIVLKRGNNTDITFGDGGKGAWTFRHEAMVSHIICDPTFKKIGADANQVRVILSNQATETGSQTVFAGDKREHKPPVGSMGPFETIELKVGPLVEDQKLRCQVLDHAGKPIVATRNTNTDITFSDAGKGPWTFHMATEVTKIICDPAFVAAPQ